MSASARLEEHGPQYTTSSQCVYLCLEFSLKLVSYCEDLVQLKLLVIN